MVDSLLRNSHNGLVAKTNAARFGSLKCTSGRSAAKAVFLRPYAIAHLLWAGDGREASACRDLVPRSSNPVICPPTSFGSEERDNQTVQGGLNG